MDCWLARVVFLLHFHRLSSGHLLLFGCQRCFIAWPPVDCSPVLGTQLLSQPLGAQHTGRGGQRRGQAAHLVGL